MEPTLDDIIDLRYIGVGRQQKASRLNLMANRCHTGALELLVVILVPNLGEPGLRLDPVVRFEGVNPLDLAIGLGAEPVLLRTAQLLPSQLLLLLLQ